MSKNIKSSIEQVEPKTSMSIFISVLPMLLRPIIRVLIRAGVNYSHFSNIARRTFVEVAINDFGISGRKTNTSRVAIMTNISRSEVTKIRKTIDAVDDIQQKTEEHRAGLASAILSKWHYDPKYTTKNGAPKTLFMSGKGATFESLFKSITGDIPITAMIKELINVGAVEKTSQGRYRPLLSYYMPHKFVNSRIITFARTYSDFIDTLEYNLELPDGSKASRMQGRAINGYINIERKEEFFKYMQKTGIEYLEKVDNWLSKNEIPIEDRNEPSQLIRLGAHLCVIAPTQYSETKVEN